MKKIIFTTVLIITANAILAQTYNMKIRQGTGSTYSETGTIDEITFLDISHIPFVCGDVVLYGGETYSTVLIGDQCWFQKNLNIGTRIDGSSNQEENSTIEKYCYNNKDNNCVTHGGLYQWNEAMQYSTTEGGQGICPTGWHIPTLDEIETLWLYVDGSAPPLKALGQGTGSGTGNNATGFSALLAGCRDYNGNIAYIGSEGFFWISTEYDDTNAYCILMVYDSNVFLVYGFVKVAGYSVRCLKD